MTSLREHQEERRKKPKNISLALSKYISMKKVSLMAYLFAFIAFSTNAQNDDFSEVDQELYKRIIRLESIQISDTPTPTQAYLHHFSLTLDFLITENPKTLEKLDTYQDKYIDLIDEGREEPWKRFFLAEIKLRSAFINVKLGNELTATWQLRQAYNLLEENIEEYPDFLPNKKTMGLLHVLLGSVPDQHQWIISLLGMDGNIQQGISELQLVSAGQSTFSLEAKILSMVIEAYLLNQSDSAANTALKIYNSHKGNELISYVAIAVLLKNSQAAKAEKIYTAVDKVRNPLILYQGGEIYLQLGQYDNAHTSLKQFLKMFKGENFIKDASYKLFLSQWLQNNDNEAKSFFEQAKKLGQKLAEADKHAAKMLKQGFPNKIIMQIRLFTDGGEYKQAQNLIDSITTDSLKQEDQLEFEYRKARLYHKQGKVEVAQTAYKSVIEMQKGNQYFAPNSCLQLGYLYRQAGDIKLAKSYFKKTLTYNNHEYKNSIDNKAKAALKEI